MMLASLRAEVLEANLELVRKGLVIDTFGNASGISREKGLVVIKPSGVPYDKMRARRSRHHRSERENRRRKTAPVIRSRNAHRAL